MISTKKLDNGDTFFEGENKDLIREEGPEILALVQAAMAAGLTEFTTPTSPNNQGRIGWKVRQWVAMKGGKPVAFLAAHKELNADFEVVGPQVPLGAATQTEGAATPPKIAVPAPKK